MKKIFFIILSLFLIVVAGFFFFIKISNIQLSESVQNEAAGLNGGFEFSESGLPVNWILYTPNTLKNADFELVVDTSEFKEGKQSLKFLVRQCSSTGGRLSPGISKEIPANPGVVYSISFWIKNIGSEYIVRIGGVYPDASDLKTVANSSADTKGWTKINHKIKITEPFNAIKFDLNILKPGTFWIDGIKIEEISE